MQWVDEQREVKVGRMDLSGVLRMLTFIQFSVVAKENRSEFTTAEQRELLLLGRWVSKMQKIMSPVQLTRLALAAIKHVDAFFVETDA